MKTYVVPVSWEYLRNGQYEIKANSPEEAIEKAYNMCNLPEDYDEEYIDWSLEIHDLDVYEIGEEENS